MPRRLDGHRGSVTAISFSKDGKLFLSASQDRTLRLWERGNPEGGSKQVASTKRVLEGHSDVVAAAVLESEGEFALSASWDRTVKLWKLDQDGDGEDDGPCLRTMRGHEHQVNAVRWSPDHRIIFTGSCDRSLKLWNNLGECKFTMKDDGGHTDWVSALSCSDELLLSAAWDGVVKLWRTKDMRVEWEMKQHTGPIFAAVLSPDGSRCASGGADRTVLVVDCKERKVIYAFDVDGIVRSLDFHPQLYWLAAATESPAGGVVWVWDLAAGRALVKLQPSRGFQGSAVAWDPEGEHLFGGFSDGAIYVWRKPDGSETSH